METKLEKRYIIEKSYSFRTLVFSLLFSVFSPLYAPPVVVPNLNTPVFNATSMDQTFNVANGMQTVGNWDAFV
ncbi:TIGR04388 family protein, partial [Leptospira kirschneri]